MPGKCRPSLRAKTLENVKRCNLSQTDKDCIQAVFERFTPQKPKKIGEEYINGRWVVDYECAACGNPYADDSYCSCCGQALDWSDTE